MARSADIAWTKADLMGIAKHQKTILWLLLLSLAASFVGLTPITALIQLYFIYKLAMAVRLSKAEMVIYVIMAFIPFISLLALASLNSKATDVLKSNGIRVGLMGAKMNDVAAI
ncbi:hypothetical protein IQ266_08970 [filamentous cyanobacterium LEGE 11480]|uniref:Uncharacterized protein n=1 Tax=Romeriopsis navalis LEGE 11480 TaxID=2777977 RepID=A0A928VPT1_9CYAN|nr:hypothetical protein [Romeriopsis navalis]MBE9029859.1 hypothetical protein [Romeriopsis navalis LEGE 11480]